MRTRIVVWMRWTVVALTASGFLLAPSGVATAGGWWSFIPIEGSVFAVGDHVESARRGEVYFRSEGAAERARAGEVRYMPHLIPDMDWGPVHRAMRVASPGDWWVQPDVAIPAGTMTFGLGDGNVGSFRMTLEVPDVEPGEYALMICSPGCEEAFASVVPTRVTISADPVTAATARRVERLRVQVLSLRRARRELSALRNRVARAETRTRLREIDADRRAAILEAEAAALRAEVADLQEAAARIPGRFSQAGWFVAGFMLALVLASILRRRRARPRSLHPAPGAGATLPAEIIGMEEGSAPGDGGDDAHGRAVGDGGVEPPEEPSVLVPDVDVDVAREPAVPEDP